MTIQAGSYRTISPTSILVLFPLVLVFLHVEAGDCPCRGRAASELAACATISKARAREDGRAGKALVPGAKFKGAPKHSVIWINSIFTRLLKIIKINASNP